MFDMIVMTCFIGFNTQYPCEYKMHDVYGSYLSCATAARQAVDRRNDWMQKQYHGDKVVTVCMPSRWEFLNDIGNDASLTVTDIEHVWDTQVVTPQN